MAACEAALKAAERQLSDLETSVPRARMEAEAEAAKAQDIQQRLDELRAATEVWGSVDGGWRVEAVTAMAQDIRGRQAVAP